MFEWTERLSVGVETIDAQHRELFASINALLNSTGTAVPAEIPKVVAFLEDYVMNHFGMEEIWEDGNQVIYAAIWPWKSDSTKITLKSGKA